MYILFNERRKIQMRKLLMKIKDNAIQIVELLIILCVLSLPSMIDVQGMFNHYVTSNTIDPDNVFFILLLGCSNKIIGVVLSFVTLWSIRKYNFEKVTMNRINTYHAYSYLWYWFSAKILNIRKCDLKKVPPYIQMKIIINNVFDEFPMDDNDYPEDEVEVKFEKKNFKNGSVPKEINIIIEDTYPIEYRQLPHSKSTLPTLKVYRVRGSDLSRYFSPKLVGMVSSEVRKLPEDITVNVFATLNPKNMMYIAQGAFAMADRGNIIHLYVFPQKSGNGRHFSDKGKKIY